MTTTDLVPVNVSARIADLARRHKAANSVGIQLLNVLGGQAENALERLPEGIKLRLEEATLKALRVAARAAQGSRGMVPDQKGWLNTALTTALTTAMGAAGGAGGLPTALAELPVTTTVLLRAIQGVAAEHGFDPAEPDVQAACLSVFASAGPLAEDDGADMAFLAMRVTLTGVTLQGVLARVAPRLATVLGQKLATQTVPVLGAAAGAAVNYAYTSYYQDMAHVVFGLRALARDSGEPEDRLADALRKALALPAP